VEVAMRILVGWDDAGEAETIGLFLGVDENTARVCTEAAELTAAASEGWDVVLLALNFPTRDEAFALFQQLGQQLPETPIIGACQQGEIIHVARFISHGLHSYLTRDAQGEFIFLLSSVIDSAYASVLAQRSRRLAERLREEIDSVRRLQESVIPRDLPHLPDYRIAARYEPSQIRVVGNQPVVMAGGDYYDAFSLNGQELILLVGDAAGHGMKACMSIMTMHTLIRMIRDQRYQDTAQFVGEVNRRLCHNEVVSDDGGFITLLYGSLDVAHHQLQWTSAGHPLPMLQDLRTGDVTIQGGEDDSGLPLGISDDWSYQQRTTRIPPNSRLLLYSDGLAEAFPEGESVHDQFGEQGIMATLRESADQPLDEALARLFADSHRFTRGSGRADDTSAMLIERRA
jgi:serine phosphatase RsbU (regulator of sigma subunit)